jgi:hypothetical protein
LCNILSLSYFVRTQFYKFLNLSSCNETWQKLVHYTHFRKTKNKVFQMFDFLLKIWKYFSCAFSAEHSLEIILQKKKYFTKVSQTNGLDSLNIGCSKSNEPARRVTILVLLVMTMQHIYMRRYTCTYWHIFVIPVPSYLIYLYIPHSIYAAYVFADILLFVRRVLKSYTIYVLVLCRTYVNERKQKASSRSLAMHGETEWNQIYYKGYVRFSFSPTSCLSRKQVRSPNNAKWVFIVYLQLHVEFWILDLNWKWNTCIIADYWSEIVFFTQTLAPGLIIAPGLCPINWSEE